MSEQSIAVVIPCFRVKKQVLGVISAIGDYARHIVVVDDACPEQSGKLVEAEAKDPRVRVIYHDKNQGVGGAMKSGYRAALEAGATVVVKLDGDGQMDPSLIPALVAPIKNGVADYTKGNRFYSISNVRSMPLVRLFGNGVLSFLTKLSSGYWSVFDPTNGFTAIHRSALGELSLDRISNRFFFETDMLVNLGGVRAVVRDIPMRASYGDEASNLRVWKVVPEFLLRHLLAASRRILYHYYLRDFSLASIELVFGLLLMGFGGIFGLSEWLRSIESGVTASTGTVMLATLPIILGFQLLLGFLSYDINNEPDFPLQASLRRLRPE